jgi:hypothetical protein
MNWKSSCPIQSHGHRKEVLSQAPYFNSQGQNMKGLCLFCQEIFNVRDHGSGDDARGADISLKRWLNSSSNKNNRQSFGVKNAFSSMHAHREEQKD